MNKFILIWVVMLSVASPAATFIGNGGSAGDLDVAIALEQIRRTAKQIDDSTERLCECSEKRSESLCAVLSALKKDQVQFCRNTLLKYQDELASLASRNSDIVIAWSTEDVRAAATAQSQGRLVDAVAQSKERRIVLNRDRFLNLPATQRIALLTHELFHFIKIGDRYVDDEKPMPPFQKGQHFLDVLGAAVAIEANNADVVDDFAALRQISRAHKPYVLGFNVTLIDRSYVAERELLGMGSQLGIGFSFEYKPNEWGVLSRWEYLTSSSDRIANATLYEATSLWSLGIYRHFHPFRSSLSRWMESHISVGIEGIYGRATFIARDRHVELRDDATVSGVKLGSQFYMPLAWGLWGVLGGEVRYVSYEYKNLNMPVRDFQTAYWFGGSYGF